MNKEGFKKEYDFAELSVAEPLQRSLAVLFAAQSRRWTSHRSAESCWHKMERFTRFLSGLEDPPVDLDELTAAMLKRWRALHIGTTTGRGTLGAVRVLLRRDPRLAAGAVAEELARRVPRGKPSKQSFEDGERERVRLAAQRQFRSAWMRIGENTRLLEQWRDGGVPTGSRDWRIGQVLDHLARTGDVPRTIMPSGQVHVTNRGLLGGGSPANTWGRLFLTRAELTALAVLLTDSFAWNMSVYDRLQAPTAAPSAGETTSVTYHIQVEKRRSGVGRWFSTENITDSGADSAGRLITQALAATSHGRALAARLEPGRNLLMVARTGTVGLEHQNMDRPRPLGPLVFGVGGHDGRSWAAAHGLGGSPFQRTRRTTVTREGQPRQHSQGTHEGVYVLPDERVQRASRDVIEAGAREALEQARAVVFAGQLADAPDPDHQPAAAVDCEDESTSPWPAPKGGCGADFLLCLACPNAHVHPGHHPRLAYLHQQMKSLRSVLDDHTWRQRWGDPLLRLEDLRDKIGPAAWKAALSRVSETDRTIVQLLVKGDLAP
jgi:hypothetical protein